MNRSNLLLENCFTGRLLYSPEDNIRYHSVSRAQNRPGAHRKPLGPHCGPPADNLVRANNYQSTKSMQTQQKTCWLPRTVVPIGRSVAGPTGLCFPFSPRWLRTKRSEVQILSGIPVGVDSRIPEAVCSGSHLCKRLPVFLGLKKLSPDSEDSPSGYYHKPFG